MPGFVGLWCSALTTVSFGAAPPEDHLALFKKVKTNLTKIAITILMIDSARPSKIGSTLKKMAGLKSVKEVKSWSVFVQVYPDLEGSTAGPVERKKLEDKDWKAWIKLCKGRGIEFKVNDDL